MRNTSVLYEDEGENRKLARLRFKAKRTNSSYTALKREFASNPSTGMTYDEFAKYHVAELTKGLPKGKR